MCIKFIDRRYIERWDKKEKPAELGDIEPSVKFSRESGKLDNKNSLNKDSTRVGGRRGNSLGE